MELTWTEIGSSGGTGEQLITIPAGKSLKIETSPNGEDILNDETPAGYSIIYHIKIIASKIAI